MRSRRMSPRNRPLPKLGSVQSFSRAASATARASWAPVLFAMCVSPHRTGLGGDCSVQLVGLWLRHLLSHARIGSVRSEAAGLTLCVPRTSSTSCDQVVFVDWATSASVSSYAVLLKIDRFG